MTKRRVRAADVAARAGVSVTAVSFVLSGKDAGKVAPTTRERILTAADELDYRPDRLARSLRRRSTQSIGVVTDGIASSPFAGRLLAAAGRRAAELGHVLVVQDTHFHTDRLAEAFAELTARRVDVLIFAALGLLRLEHVPKTVPPLVLANCYQEPPVLPSAIPDEFDVGRRAARLLADAGHRRIVMIGGRGDRDPARHLTGNIAGPARLAGFRAGLRDAGLPTGRGGYVSTGWDIEEGHAAAWRVFADDAGALRPREERPTAVFAVNDRIATGVMLAAAQLGLVVPRDLSVVGVDDQEALAAHLVPALTTFRLPHTEMGEWAVEQAVAAVRHDRPAPELIRFRCELVERATVAPPG